MHDRSTVEVIFFQALEASSELERTAILDQACPVDDSLRRRVEDLLAAHLQMGQFLEHSLIESHAVAEFPVDRVTASLATLGPSTEPNSLGRLDDFEVIDVVGHGGMGVVLRAQDRKLGRIVAIKMLSATLATSGKARHWFAREARAAAAIRDDHVVAIHAVRDDAVVPYMVMEFIDGGNLASHLQDGPLEIEKIVRFGVQIARGLASAHKQGIIHRDVKPANILLESGIERVKLTDFGLAQKNG